MFSTIRWKKDMWVRHLLNLWLLEEKEQFKTSLLFEVLIEILGNVGLY